LIKKNPSTYTKRESTVYPVADGIPFLGFRVYPTHRLLKRRNALAFQRRLRGWRRSLGAGRLALDDIHARVRGWVAHARHGDTGRPTKIRGRRGLDEGRAATPVLRGGSWNNDQRNARCAVRNRNDPDNFNNNVGFRVVVSIACCRWPVIPVICPMRDGAIDICQRSPFRVASAGGAAAGRIPKRPRVPPLHCAARGFSPHHLYESWGARGHGGVPCRVFALLSKGDILAIMNSTLVSPNLPPVLKAYPGGRPLTP
jgi:hypothetical protein